MATYDIDACKRLGSKLKSERISCATTVFSAESLYRLIKTCRLSIDFKLHAGIISAAAQRPPISLAYRLKCIEFAATINNLDFCIPMNEVTVEDIVQRVAQIEQHYDALVSRLAQAQETYSLRVDQSIKYICDLLLDS